MSRTGKFYGKLIIEGELYCETGMHIGSGKELMEIGGLDSPVVRDPITREPYIPGSSLKGKLRTLLEKQQFAANIHKAWDEYFNKIVKSGGREIRHHECGQDDCTVCRLFGASQGNGVNDNSPARLAVSDAHLTKESKQLLENIDTGLYLTELKFENALDRLTAAASPRQIERVPRGSIFQFKLIYDQDQEGKKYYQDVQAILNALRLLEDDALGGSTSRGYGRVSVQKLNVVYRSKEYYKLGDKQAERILQQGEDNLIDFSQRVQTNMIGQAVN